MIGRSNTGQPLFSPCHPYFHGLYALTFQILDFLWARPICYGYFQPQATTTRESQYNIWTESINSTLYLNLFNSIRRKGDKDILPQQASVQTFFDYTFPKIQTGNCLDSLKAQLGGAVPLCFNASSTARIPTTSTIASSVPEVVCIDFSFCSQKPSITSRAYASAFQPT